MIKISTLEELLSRNEVQVLGKQSYTGHEKILFCKDPKTKLKAIIAVHNTKLGPGLGGCRMWNYKNQNEAIIDVLRLSRGMTYKASITGLDLGGGKAVIIGDSKTEKTTEMMESFGEFVESLAGKYITAEDVGMSPNDMEIISRKTNHVVGRPKEMGGSGDPSIVTAYGVYMGIKGSAKYRWGKDQLENKKVFVQGVGKVGGYLIEYLKKEGCEITINDIDDEKMMNAVKKYGVKVISSDQMFNQNIDIYAPCALGATLNDTNIEKLNCEIIAGAANNQLAEEGVNDITLKKKGILYAPDFLINAGGLINVYSELKNWNQEKTLKKTENIYDTTISILSRSDAEDISTHKAALSIAKERLIN